LGAASPELLAPEVESDLAAFLSFLLFLAFFFGSPLAPLVASLDPDAPELADGLLEVPPAAELPEVSPPPEVPGMPALSGELELAPALPAPDLSCELAPGLVVPDAPDDELAPGLLVPDAPDEVSLAPGEAPVEPDEVPV
jgi:hypothetical protein